MKQMNTNFLSKSERQALEFRQRLSKNKKESDRIRTILLLNKGWCYQKIAEALFLDEGTLSRYYTIYVEKGLDALLTFHYSGKPCALKPEQLELVKAHVQDTQPVTVQPIVEYIRSHFSVEYTASATVALLHRLGFVYKKPTLVPGKADASKQEEFLQQLDDDLQESDKVIYMDGVHPQHNSKPAYGWMIKGKESVLKANSGRQRININGALDIDNMELTINEGDSVNAQSTIELFQQLEKKYPESKRIVIICDNAAYYRSNLVREYIRDSRITLKFLPPYSPNLNLIERLWRFMNKKVRDNKYYEKFSDFKNALFGFFKNLHLYKNDLKRLLVKKFHIIKI